MSKYIRCNSDICSLSLCLGRNLIRTRFFLFSSALERQFFHSIRLFSSLTECMMTLMLFHTTRLYLTFPDHNQPALSSSCSTQIRLRKNPKNNNSTKIIFCITLKIFQKVLALIMIMMMILLSSASTNTIQLQLSGQGCCIGTAAGCYSHPLQNVVYFCCPALAYFLFWLVMEKSSENIGHRDVCLHKYN